MSGGRHSPPTPPTVTSLTGKRADNSIIGYDRINQHLDWGDHTVTIDPIFNHPWIHEGQDRKHQAAAERGRAFNAANVKHILSMMDNTQLSLSFYHPTLSDLDKCPKFESRRNGDCDNWRGKLRDMRGIGELPVIAAQNYHGTLPDKPKSLIEREIYDQRAVIQQKVLSLSGVPDFGLPSYTDQRGF